MKEVTVSIYHKGCWGSETTKKFPGIVLKQHSPNIITKREAHRIVAQGIWEVHAPSEPLLRAFLRHLAEHKAIKKLEAIEEFSSRAVVFMSWELEYSPYEEALSVGCIPTEPAINKNGEEIYTFAAHDNETLDRALELLKKSPEFKIIRIGKIKKKKEKLTSKQRSALQLAVLYDYYSWPRNVTLQDLSNVAGISRRGFEELLRKAESKVLPQLIKELLSESMLRAR